MKLFKKLFCKHDYHIRKERRRVEQNPNFTMTSQKKWDTFEIKTCKYCGKTKERKLHLSREVG